MDIKKYFKELRFNAAHHLGAGDIRITIGQQKEIERAFESRRNALARIAEGTGCRECGGESQADIARDELQEPNVKEKPTT